MGRDFENWSSLGLETMLSGFDGGLDIGSLTSRFRHRGWASAVDEYEHTDNNVVSDIIFLHSILIPIREPDAVTLRTGRPRPRPTGYGHPVPVLPGSADGTLIQLCKDLDEGKENWMRHKKETTWRLSRLEQQLESEKARRRREKTEEIEKRIRCIREEEAAFLSRMEGKYREQLNALQRDGEAKEEKLMEAWCSKHLKLEKVLKQIRIHASNEFLHHAS